METIEYRATFAGTYPLNRASGPLQDDRVVTEVIRVSARNTNAGFAKALRLAMEPLGNGARRELATLEFWQVVL